MRRGGKVEHRGLWQLSADGGSNAIGAVQEFEGIGRDEGRSNLTDFAVCWGHHNERSGGYASGAVKFADPPNDDLGNILKKSDKIQVRQHQSYNCMDVYRGLQDKKSWDPQLNPDPAGDTRWQGELPLVIYCAYYEYLPTSYLLYIHS